MNRKKCKTVLVMSGLLSNASRREIKAPISKGLSRDVTTRGPPRGTDRPPHQHRSSTKQLDVKDNLQASTPAHVFPLKHIDQGGLGGLVLAM